MLLKTQKINIMIKKKIGQRLRSFNSDVKEGYSSRNLIHIHT